MSCIFSFSRYQTKCVIKFLLWQLVTSRTLRLIFHQPLKQRLTGRKTGKDGNINFEYLENEKHFLDEIKNIFHSFWRAIIWWEIKIWWKIADTSFKFIKIFGLLLHPVLITNILQSNCCSYNSQWKSLLMVNKNSHWVWRFIIYAGKSTSTVLWFHPLRYLMTLVKCQRKLLLFLRTSNLRNFQFQWICTFTRY